MQLTPVSLQSKEFASALTRVLEGARAGSGLSDELALVVASLQSQDEGGHFDDLSKLITPTSVAVDAKLSDPFVSNLAEFKAITEEKQAMDYTYAAMEWDTYEEMPEKGMDERAWVMGVLEARKHELSTSIRLGELLEYFQSDENFRRLDPIDQRIVQQLKKLYDKDIKLPTEFVKQFVEIKTKSYDAWGEARKDNDFAKFSPWLQQIVDFFRQRAELIGYEKSPYDTAIDDYEEGMTAETLEAVFADLRDGLVPIIKQITESGAKPVIDLSSKTFPADKQREISEDVLRLMNFDFEAGKLKETTDHPATYCVGPNDARITNRVELHNPMPAVTIALHEGGHGIYWQGYDESLYRTPLATSPSYGMDEAQARMIENIVGRGLPFLKFYYPKLQEAFPEQLGKVSLDDFYRFANNVNPSLIRIFADEVTYNLHIVIRFELEKALVEGTLEVDDLPQAFKEKMQEYLGITPPDDKNGVLQDGHWSDGSFGYFPTYTLGNLYAAQIYHTAKKEIPNLEGEIEKGNLRPLTDWLKEKIFRHGDMYNAEDLLIQVTGESLNAKYFVDYIKEKFGKIYNLEL